MNPQCDRERLHRLFSEMVDRYSPSGKEKELLLFLEEVLKGTGLCVERQPLADTRWNLLVSAEGAHRSGNDLFLGHIDTVPAFDLEQTGFREHDGICSGLGTADMKSGCAAMIEAFMTATEQGCLPGPALLALVVGEEENGDGTRRLLDEYSFDTALVAEPTDLAPCLDHYGYIEMVVRAFGYRRHAAMAMRETNAIRAMLRLLIKLEDRMEDGSDTTVFNIRDLHSSESGFAVPDRCSAAIDVHLPPDTDARKFAGELETFAAAHLEESRASRYAIEFPTLADGYRGIVDAPLCRRLHTVFTQCGRAWNPAAFTSHSDANLLNDGGCRPVILGPGQLAKAHTLDETVAFEQVASAADIYLALLAQGR